MCWPAGVEKLKVSPHSLQLPCRCSTGMDRTLTWYLLFFRRCSMSTCIVSDLDTFCGGCGEKRWWSPSLLNIFNGNNSDQKSKDVTVSLSAVQMCSWNSWFLTFRKSLLYGVRIWNTAWFDSRLNVTFHTWGLLGFTGETQHTWSLIHLKMIQSRARITRSTTNY